MKDLLSVLARYEGAVGEVERDGDDSDEAIDNLNNARADMLELLQVAKAWEESNK